MLLIQLINLCDCCRCRTACGMWVQLGYQLTIFCLLIFGYQQNMYLCCYMIAPVSTIVWFEVWVLLTSCALVGAVLCCIPALLYSSCAVLYSSSSSCGNSCMIDIGLTPPFPHKQTDWKRYFFPHFQYAGQYPTPVTTFLNALDNWFWSNATTYSTYIV